MEEIENKVAKSGLISLDLGTLLPSEKEISEIDIKDQLWQGIALKEKLFRSYVKETDWSVYKDQFVGVFCSEDAIIPSWAYMLVASALQPYAKLVVLGNKEKVKTRALLYHIENLDPKEYQGERVIAKGCGDSAFTDEAFLAVTQKLQPVVKTLMYGEPCSTVPIYKAPKK